MTKSVAVAPPTYTSRVIKQHNCIQTHAPNHTGLRCLKKARAYALFASHTHTYIHTHTRIHCKKRLDKTERYQFAVATVLFAGTTGSCQYGKFCCDKINFTATS